MRFGSFICNTISDLKNNFNESTKLFKKNVKAGCFLKVMQMRQ